MKSWLNVFSTPQKCKLTVKCENLTWHAQNLTKAQLSEQVWLCKCENPTQHAWHPTKTQPDSMCPESTQKSNLIVTVCNVSASMTKWDIEQNKQSVGGHRPLVLCRERWQTEELMSQTDTWDCLVTLTEELWHLYCYIHTWTHWLSTYIPCTHTREWGGARSGIVLPCLKPSKNREKWSQVLMIQGYFYSISICRKHFIKVFCISNGIWYFQGRFYLIADTIHLLSYSELN